MGARRYRVVRYEMRGHGATPSPDVEAAVTMDDLGADVVALMDELGIERAHHVGLSIGGMLASWMAQHHPERVDRLAIVCSSSYLPPAERWTERATTVRERGMGEIVDAVLANWFTPDFHDADTLADLRDRFLACDAEGYAQCCEAIASTDLRPGLGSISATTLVVAGADDDAAPPAMSEETAV
ncbi:MAG: alpha/beta fold hydrolase, partial [Actinomycetaceae bacterium]